MKFVQFFGHPVRCVVSAFVVSLLLSSVVIAVRGIPAPKIQDEFAYLLGADTFASGRVTNPTHPMWQHFESIHIIHQPSYAAKYPPMQSLMLALGQSLGHPVVGVCLGTAMSIAALVWMLIGCLPERSWWMAWMLAVLHPGFHTYWGHSYWGGAVALTGAALLLGSFFRTTGELKTRYALIAAVGTLMLANSRPFEGAVLAATVGVGLFAKFWMGRDGSASQFFSKLLIPGAAVVAFGAIAMAGYNHQVTGSVWKFPYQVHESTYAWNPVFIWQTAGEPPAYRHPDMRNFFAHDKLTTERAFPDLASMIQNKSKVLIGLLDFFCGPLMLLALLGWLVQPKLLTERETWVTLALLAPVLAASIISKWANFHYAAPAAPLIMLIGLRGALQLWDRFSDQPSLRRIGGWSLLAFQLIWVIAVVGETGRQDRDNWGDSKVTLTKQLANLPGKDLVLVRYAEDHHEHHEWIEWVYNRADIDNAEVAWAREMSPRQRSELLRYFADRRIWVLDADEVPVQLRPFQTAPAITAIHQGPEKP